MTDFSLKFLDEAEAISVLYTDGVTNYQNIDVLGTLYTDDDDALEGWHVNIRDEGECLELAQYIVIPKNPRRVWA